MRRPMHVVFERQLQRLVERRERGTSFASAVLRCRLERLAQPLGVERAVDSKAIATYGSFGIKVGILAYVQQRTLQAYCALQFRR